MDKKYEVVGLTSGHRSHVISRFFDLKTDAISWRDQLLKGRCTYALAYDVEKNAPIQNQ